MSVRLGKATNESTSGMQENINLITKFQNQLDLEIIGKITDSMNFIIMIDVKKSMEFTIMQNSSIVFHSLIKLT